MKTLLVNTQSSTPWFLILMGRDPKKVTDRSEPINSRLSVFSGLFYFQWEVPNDVILMFPGSEMKWNLQFGHRRVEGVWKLVQYRGEGVGFVSGRWQLKTSALPLFCYVNFISLSLIFSFVNEETIIPHSVILKIKQNNTRMYLLQSPLRSSI